MFGSQRDFDNRTAEISKQFSGYQAPVPIENTVGKCNRARNHINPSRST